MGHLDDPIPIGQWEPGLMEACQTLRIDTINSGWNVMATLAAGRRPIISEFPALCSQPRAPVLSLPESFRNEWMDAMESISDRDGGI